MIRDAVLMARLPLVLAVLLFFTANLLTGAQTCRLEQLPQCPKSAEFHSAEPLHAG